MTTTAQYAVLLAFRDALIGMPGVGPNVHIERVIDLSASVQAAILIEDDGSESREIGSFTSESMSVLVVIKARASDPRLAVDELLAVAHPRIFGLLQEADGQVQTIVRRTQSFEKVHADVPLGELTVRYQVTFECDALTLQ